MRAGVACSRPAGHPTKGLIPRRHPRGPALRSGAMHTVRTIDCQYLGLPGFAAAYLIVEGDRAAFVENNTAHAVPLLLKALAEAGLSPEQVEYAFVTHVHLDHAGGSSALMQACPRATLIAHPRAARHLIDPSKLVASATQVYGAERFRQLYGDIQPIDEARVRTVEDGERMRLGARELTFLHTRGHANHHMCILDSGSNGLFTGDAFGLTYPALQTHGTFAFPTTSPTDFLVDEAIAVVHQLASVGAERVFPTHFGEHTDVSGIAEQLLGDLAFSKQLQAEAQASSLSGGDLERFCHERLLRHYEARLAERGLPRDEATWKLLALDLELNAQGVAYAATKQRKG